MPGGPTHKFPHGTPLALQVGGIALIALFFGISWAQGWWKFLPIVLLALGFAAYLKLIRYYERKGIAVPIHFGRAYAEFPSGVPRPLVLARGAFFVVLALMLVFGTAPLDQRVAGNGIIGCVLSSLVVAIACVALERYYVKTGRAIEIEASPPKQPQR
jgi:hypothetical protein